MNVCHDKHTPLFQITYRGSRQSGYNPEWLVCKECLESKPGFADKYEIMSIVLLQNGSDTN
jgi:hypothetical protein